MYPAQIRCFLLCLFLSLHVVLISSSSLLPPFTHSLPVTHSIKLFFNHSFNILACHPKRVATCYRALLERACWHAGDFHSSINSSFRIHSSSLTSLDVIAAVLSTYIQMWEENLLRDFRLTEDFPTMADTERPSTICTCAWARIERCHSCVLLGHF